MEFDMEVDACFEFVEGARRVAELACDAPRDSVSLSVFAAPHTTADLLKLKTW
jgi:hypothetical protein